jgi:hypothetical protein
MFETTKTFRTYIKNHKQHLKNELYKQKLDMIIVRCRELFHNIRSTDKLDKIIYIKMREQQNENRKQMKMHYREMQDAYKETNKLWNIINPVLFKLI